MERSKVYLTREQSRLVDKLAIENGITGISLMENAAKRCVILLTELKIESAVICCGTGNNGGDGFVIARRLAVQGVPVKTILCGDPDKIEGDALTNYGITQSLDVQILQLEDDWSDSELAHRVSVVENQPVDCIVDCLLGTGSVGDPRPPMDRVINALNGVEARRFAVDVPSGLDCETGVPGKPTFKADMTCTFVAKKTGFANEAAKPYLGTVRVGTIGVPDDLVERIITESSVEDS